MASHADKLEKVIRKEVAEYMKDVPRPFALMLSGGVDSALLAYLTKPDLLITCRFTMSKYDEFYYAQKVAKHLKIPQEVIIADRYKFRTRLKDAVRMHKPTTHFSLVPLYLIFERAKKLGFNHILSAEGPDEYLGGYTSYSFITQEESWYDQPEMKNYHPTLDRYLGTPQERFARILNVPLKDVNKHWGNFPHLLSNIGYADLKLRGIEEMELDLAKGHKMKLPYPFMTKKIERY